jgi:cell division protein FtsB
MKSMHMPVITLALSLGAAGAAWGAESVMNLVNSGEAVQKELAATKARMDAAVQRNKDVAAQGNELAAEKAKLMADFADWQKENDDVKQRTTAFQNRCSPDRHLDQQQLNACKKDADELNADIAKVNSDNAELNKRNAALNARIPGYNDEAQKAPAEQDAAYEAYNAATKKERSWLDAARDQLANDAFKSYGEKAGCPDMSKPPQTTDAMVKMTDDIVACLKKVSHP